MRKLQENTETNTKKSQNIWGKEQKLGGMEGVGDCWTSSTWQFFTTFLGMVKRPSQSLFVTSNYKE